MLHPQQRTVARTIQRERDGQGCEHTGDSGVDPGVEHAIPQQRGSRGIGPRNGDFQPVQHCQSDQHRRRHTKPDQVESGGIDQRDDRHRAKIVGDRHGQQEQPERPRHPSAEQAEHAEGESDVGRRRNRPAARETGSAPPAQQIDQRGQCHPRNRGKHRQPPSGRTRQFAAQHLALDLQPDHEKEQRHRRVVDPQVPGVELGYGGPAEAVVEQRVIGLAQRRIGQHQRRGGDQHEQNSGRGLAGQPRDNPLPHACG